MLLALHTPGIAGGDAHDGVAQAGVRALADQQRLRFLGEQRRHRRPGWRQWPARRRRPSGISPVSKRRRRAGRRDEMPRIAAESSNTTMNAGGSLERRNASHQPRLRLAAGRRAMPTSQEAPSKASDDAEHAQKSPAAARWAAGAAGGRCPGRPRPRRRARKSAAPRRSSRNTARGA